MRNAAKVLLMKVWVVRSPVETKFVLLTTFHKTGVAISSPVWIALDGTDLIVTTAKESGKVKRLRNDARVEIRPSSRRGAVEPDAPTEGGRAVVVDDDAARDKLTRIFKGKYRWEYRMFLLIERIVARREKMRVLIRISPASAGDPQ